MSTRWISLVGLHSAVVVHVAYLNGDVHGSVTPRYTARVNALAKRETLFVEILLVMENGSDLCPRFWSEGCDL